MTPEDLPFPAVAVDEHDRVLAEMSGQLERWHGDHDAATLREWLDKPVGDWFVNHIRTMDFVTAEFACRHPPAR